MPNYTPRLNLPKPLGSENNTRANFNALIDAIDSAAETPAGAQAKADAAEQAAKEYTDSRVDSLGKEDIGLGNLINERQATKTEFDAHTADNVRHITASERSNWNAKETTQGAQEKANAARDAAIEWATAANITLLPKNAYAFTDSGSDYPNGVTTFEVDTDQGWPYRGSVLNFKDSNVRFGQILISNTSHTMLYRDHRSGGWTNFKEAVLTSGATFTGNVEITKSYPDVIFTPTEDSFGGIVINDSNGDRIYKIQFMNRDIRVYDYVSGNVVALSLSLDEELLRVFGTPVAVTNGNYANLRARATTKSDVGLGNVTNDAQLKISSNLSDIANVSTARSNLGLTGSSNTTHYHDSRYYTKSEIDTELNSVKQSVGNGKTAIRDAIIDAGGTAPTGSPDSYTHQDLANAISTVSKYASGSTPAQATVQIRGINFDVGAFSFFYQTSDDGGVSVMFTSPYSPFVRKTSTTAGDPVITPVSGGFDITLDRPAGTDLTWEAWGS